MAVEYGQRPSSFFGLTSAGWLTFQFDAVVFAYGRWVNNRRIEKTKDGKYYKYTFEEALGIETKPKVIDIAMLKKAFGDTIDID